MRAAAEEGRDLADSVGDRFNSRQCRIGLGVRAVVPRWVADSVEQFAAVAVEAETAHDGMRRVDCLAYQGVALAYQGDTDAGRAPRRGRRGHR